MMKKLAFNGLILLSALFVMFSIALQATAGERVYLMTGKITAIDLNPKTVVIDIPMVGKIFTVGGPLSARAVLKKNSHAANLRNFVVGEKVKVKWRSTDEGHIIEMIESM